MRRLYRHDRKNQAIYERARRVAMYAAQAGLELERLSMHVVNRHHVERLLRMADLVREFALHVERLGKPGLLGGAER